MNVTIELSTLHTTDPTHRLIFSEGVDKKSVLVALQIGEGLIAHKLLSAAQLVMIGELFNE